MNLEKPSQQLFLSALATIQLVIRLHSSNIDTRKASVVRLLVVRPIAYLFAQISKYIDNRVKLSSIANLLTSTKTLNLVADMVASNYFVYRKLGSRASGVICATCTMSPVRIPRLTTFIIDGTAFVVSSTIIATTDSKPSVLGLTYIKAVSMGDTYICNIPVRAKYAGAVLIPAGVQVTTSSYIAGVSKLLLVSPITGGASVLTDALMMQRCIKKCGAAVGTQNAIWTRLQLAPVSVLSCKAIGSNDPGCFRARYNSLNIPRAGVVDVYAKTQKQASVLQLLFPLRNQTKIELDSAHYTQIAGFIRISSVYSTDGEALPLYTILYVSTDTLSGDIGARLSNKQKAIITFSSAVTKDVLIDVLYMPGVLLLQNYINRDDVAFLGQDTLVKAAVPVTVCVHCSVLSLDALDLTAVMEMRLSVSSLICAKLVGDCMLNMDDIAARFNKIYTHAKLKLPYNILVSVPMSNNGVYTFNTNSGVVDLNYRKTMYLWDTAAYFFSTTANQVLLSVL